MTLRSFFVAVQFLTRVPTPTVENFVPEDLSRSAVFFPLVGGLIGLVLLGAGFFGSGVGSLFAALLVVVGWVWITGGLHIDGLGDVADALGAAHQDRERFIEVLRDPHLGTFGVLAIALQLIIKLVLVEDLIRHGNGMIALLLVPAWARWAATAIAQWVEPLATGSGARFRWSISTAVIAGNAAGLAVLSAVFAPALLVAAFVTAGLVLYWRTVTGGITGDCLGASIEVTESALLLSLVVVAALMR